MTASISISAALADRNLLGATLGGMASWSTWLSVLKASFADALSTRDREVFARVAGNRSPPSRMVRELWAIVGRRAGKSRVAAAISAYVATCIDHGGKLSPGETGMVLVLASTTSQAKAVFNYILAFVQASPVLAQQIDAVTANEIRLRGDIEIAVHSNSFRSIRGRTLLACVFDEIAFWRDETSSEPDIEVYRAVLPALATTQGMLIGISSHWLAASKAARLFRC
jgi:phage terminase large subunit-like protein